MSEILVPIPETRTRPMPARTRPRPMNLMEAGPDEPVTGILLAGGRSRRMGHRDKAWASLAGKPLVRWVLDALQSVTEQQVIVTRDAGQRQRLEELGLPVVVDKVSARGALSGIHAGLSASQTELCVVAACDMPLVRPALLAHLAGSVGPMDAAVPYIGEGAPPPRIGGGGTARDSGVQPLLAAYRKRCVEPLEQLLESGPLPTTALLSVIRARIVPPEDWQAADPDGRSFLNVNTPEDLVSAMQRLNEG